MLRELLIIALAAHRPILADMAVDIKATLKQAKEYFTQQQYDRALPLLLTAAKADDWEAMRYLGLIYDGGLGVSKDDAQAAKWYRKAADAGDAAAMEALGAMFETGRGVSQDAGHA